MSSAFVRGKGTQRRFYVRWKNEQGIWRKEKYAAATLTEAKDEARRREQEAQEIRTGGKRKQKKDITLREAVEMHLAALPPDFKSRKSLEGLYRNRILEVPAEGSRKAGDFMCRDFTAGHLKAVLACKKDCSAALPTRAGGTRKKGLMPNAEVSKQTREHVRVAMQGLYTFLKQSRRVEENPAGELGKLKIPKKTPRYLLPRDMPPFIAALPAERRLHFAFNLASGARKTESLELQWPDVHEDQGHVVLDHTKNNEGRTVYLPDWLIVLLRAHRAQSTSQWVFPKPEGLKGAGGKQPAWEGLHRITKTALRDAGLIDHYVLRCVPRGKMKSCKFRKEQKTSEGPACPQCKQNTLQAVPVPIRITFHNLRSTFATWAWAQTRDIHFVQLMLGHWDTRTTQRYAAAVDEHMRRLANQIRLNPFEGALGPELPSLPQGDLGTQEGQAKGKHVHNGANVSTSLLSQTTEEIGNA